MHFSGPLFWCPSKKWDIKRKKSLVNGIIRRKMIGEIEPHGGGIMVVKEYKHQAAKPHSGDNMVAIPERFA
jgi:hypothetical protein